MGHDGREPRSLQQRFSCPQPFNRDRTDRQRDDPARDGGVRVHVAKAGKGRPKRIFIVVQMPCRAPQRERHSVGSGHPTSVALVGHLLVFVLDARTRLRRKELCLPLGPSAHVG